MNEELPPSGGSGSPDGNSEREGGDASAMPSALVRDRARPSIVWLIPLIAAFVGAFLAVSAYMEQGPTITIVFRSAEGVEAGKTKIKFKDVEIGMVETVELTEDLSNVVVTAELVKGAGRYLTENTRFWVVRAEVSAGQITGLDTVLSGAYIGIDPSSDGARARSFEGLETPPVVRSDADGTLFRLRADDLGSVDIGAPVYFKWLRVGQVARVQLDPSGEFVDLQVFVRAPHDERVRTTTRFWNAAGFDASIGARGIEIDSPSLVSMLVGGIAFETPATVDVARSVPEDMVFSLYPSRQATRRPIYLIKERFLLHFDESVSGLVAGSHVEFRGIQIGEVIDVHLEYVEEDGRMEIPVVIEVEPERIAASMPGTGGGISPQMVRLVENGFRARLKTSNLVTGARVVDFDLVADAEPQEILFGGVYPELPTLGGSIDAITQRVARILDKVDQVPIESIGRNLDGALAGLQGTLSEMESLTGSANQDMMPAIQASLAKLEGALGSADSLISPDSPMTRDLERLMADLAEAARSMRLLAERLEQHPEELLRGKTK